MRKIKISIISLLAIAFCSPLFSQENEITMDASKSLGEINPFVYGQFIEYMGRCIDGGIYEENSPLSDAGDFEPMCWKKRKSWLRPCSVFRVELS